MSRRSRSSRKWDASDALKNQPNKHFVEVAELAALTLFLCTDNGASVTGVALPMDGGWTAPE
ncbi:MAG: 3-hydroxybutyrate dehydrogenase [Bradyrhizobium sp.]|jgi:3-hydroxybutyrate dehydrogenase|nr:3-hydroxybutyrate dehydrogenase [Bradyrhizobium sp.]